MIYVFLIKYTSSFYPTKDATDSNMKSAVSFGLLNIGECLLTTSRTITSPPVSFAILHYHSLGLNWERLVLRS
jgi:hypothetical protein